MLECDRENRERRIGIDRVKDSVEKRLLEENDTILHYQQLMKELVNQVCLKYLISGLMWRIIEKNNVIYR